MGGIVSRSILTHLAETFGVSLPLRAEVERAKSPESPRHLELENMEALWGQFKELETYLKEQKIPFDRVSDGKYGDSPELRRFRSGRTNVQGLISQPEIDRTFLCDHENRPMVAPLDIQKAIADTKTRRELAGRLRMLCGSDIPGLPLLRVVETVLKSNDNTAAPLAR